MKRPEPKYEQMEVPRLADKIKKMNGKSGQKLTECIDALSDLLDENEAQHEETTDESSDLRDTGTE